jgi:hypothetical protein
MNCFAVESLHVGKLKTGAIGREDVSNWAFLGEPCNFALVFNRAVADLPYSLRHTIMYHYMLWSCCLLNVLLGRLLAEEEGRAYALSQLIALVGY